MDRMAGRYGGSAPGVVAGHRGPAGIGANAARVASSSSIRDGEGGGQYPDSAYNDAGGKRNGPGASLQSYGDRDYSAVNERDVKAIFQAMRHNRAQEVTELLDKGVPINVKDKFGNTLLAVACQNGLKRLAKLALRRGANINSRNYKGNTPLHFCYTYGYGDTLGAYLISKGADPTIRNHSGNVCHDGLGGGSQAKK